MLCDRDNEIWDKLVSKSPKVTIKLFETPALCLLDTGAETSLISETYFQKFLAHKTEITKLNVCFPVVGVNGTELPVIGFVEIPLQVFGVSKIGYFLIVKQDFREGMATTPVIIGANILKEFLNVPIDDKDAEATPWILALECLKQSVNQSETLQTLKGPINLRISRFGMKLPPNSVSKVPIRIRKPLQQYEGKLVFIEECITYSSTT